MKIDDGIIPDGYECRIGYLKNGDNHLDYDGTILLAEEDDQGFIGIIVSKLHVPEYPDFIPQGWFVARDCTGAIRATECKPEFYEGYFGHTKGTAISGLEHSGFDFTLTFSQEPKVQYLRKPVQRGDVPKKYRNQDI